MHTYRLEGFAPGLPWRSCARARRGGSATRVTTARARPAVTLWTPGVDTVDTVDGCRENSGR